jgi:hypothetical protein
MALGVSGKLLALRNTSGSSATAVVMTLCPGSQQHDFHCSFYPGLTKMVL